MFLRGTKLMLGPSAEGGSRVTRIRAPGELGVTVELKRHTPRVDNQGAQNSSWWSWS